MPRITDYLYYRLIDVTTVKELITRWYPDNRHIQFEKQDAHRALSDIRESIAELKHYRRYFLV
jgi:oligoribonuclease